MKPRRSNPTLVHHGKRRAAAFHVLTRTGRPLADLYGMTIARAKKIAARFGVPTVLLDNRHRPKTLAAHPKVKVRAARTIKRRSSSRRHSPPKRHSVRNRGRRRVRRNPVSPAIAAGARTYRTWHGFGNAEVLRQHVREIPRVLVKLGEIHALEYFSNKWGRRRELYRHVTSNPKPRLYTGPDGRGYFVVGGAMRTTARGLVH